MGERGRGGSNKIWYSLQQEPPSRGSKYFVLKKKNYCNGINSFAEFHSNLFSCFYCRHILSSLHFNENLLREPQKTKNGKEYLLVIYPKYKAGEEVVREIKVPPTYRK